MKNENQISCPNCGEQIDVNDILTHQIEDSIRKDYQKKEALAKKELEALEEELNKEKTAFILEKRKKESEFQELLDKNLKTALKAEQGKVRSKIEEENKEMFDSLSKELNDKSEKLKELNKSKAEIEKLKREKAEAESKAKAEAQIELSKQLQLQTEKIQKHTDEVNELKFKEYEKQLADQKKLMQEMKRKHEQGSMQLQGEVQELAIEEWLASTFPLDTIDEIKKGARGADCVQIVNTRESQNCGSIYYESKRTKDFQPTWIEKFKNDIRERGSNIGVLVTEVLPKDMDRMGMKDGIWICTYEEFKGLSNVLRQSIIQLSNAMVSQENKGDKMELLYSFLTSNEFKLHFFLF